MERQQQSKPDRARFRWATYLTVIAAVWIVSDILGVVIAAVRHIALIAIAMAALALFARIFRTGNS